MSPDDLKRDAALRAAALVESGMVLGLGTGSTARHFVAEVGRLLADGTVRDLRCVPTSAATEAQATALGIPIVDLPETGVDLAVDGMDEYDDALDAIKGHGGALVREKIVAASATTFVLIGDGSKHVTRLGERMSLPVEVVVFGWRRTAAVLAELGATPVLRGGRQPFVSDNGNHILDCAFASGYEPAELARSLSQVPGVVEHGLFLGLADRAFVATAASTTELRRGVVP